MAFWIITKNSLKVATGETQNLLLLKQLHVMYPSIYYKNKMDGFFISNFKNGNPHLGKTVGFLGIDAH